MVDAADQGLKSGLAAEGGFDQMQEMLKQVAPMGQFGMKLFQQLMDSGTLEVLAQQRYIHRLDMRGRPLHYEAVVARRAPGSEHVL